MNHLMINKKLLFDLTYKKCEVDQTAAYDSLYFKSAN